MKKVCGSCVELSPLKIFGSMFDAETIHAQFPSNIEPNNQWNIALNLGHWDTRSWTKPLPVRLFSAKSCKLEEEREAKDVKGYERFSLSHFVLPSPNITRVENRPQKRMGRKLEMKTVIGWLWRKDAFARTSASYPHLVFDLGFASEHGSAGGLPPLVRSFLSCAS